jgi:hypothetical protein
MWLAGDKGPPPPLLRDGGFGLILGVVFGFSLFSGFLLVLFWY